MSADKELKEKIDKENFKNMLNAFDEAKDVLYANTLFIKKDFIDKYLGLLKLAGEQKFVFEQR
ncbi:MAG: hypothetical protein IJT79_06515 [Ruminococcus sp.]|nr:hypothetical protein [Ruminococcus sp.]